MKRSIFLLLLIPMLALSQPAKVINTIRVFPKIEKATAFEKALAAHVAKYHQSKWTWRVFSIETGPDAGGYHIVEGPASWDEFDKRGYLGQAHQQDWEQTIAPLVTEKFEAFFSVYRDDLSSTPLTTYTEKIAINHVYYNPGYSVEMESIIQSLKSVWEASQRTTAVYEMSSSGEPGFVLVSRYKDGLKERDPGYKQIFKDAYEKSKGAGSWQAYQDLLKKAVNHSWSEILVFKPSMSSK